MRNRNAHGDTNRQTGQEFLPFHIHLIWSLTAGGELRLLSLLLSLPESPGFQKGFPYCLADEAAPSPCWNPAANDARSFSVDHRPTGGRAVRFSACANLPKYSPSRYAASLFS